MILADHFGHSNSEEEGVSLRRLESVRASTIEIIGERRELPLELGEFHFSNLKR